MNELTSFQRDLVYCIAALEEPSGMEVSRELEEYTVAEVNHGRLYPNLNELVEEGLVKKGKQDDRTNQYTLTPLGRELIKERRQWENEKLQEAGIALD